MNMENKLMELVTHHPYLHRLFKVADLYLPDYYVAAGCITQTVWNHLHNYEWTYGVKDADLVYFNTSNNQEKKLEKEIRSQLPDFPFQIDVTNEAFVHEWYEEKFGLQLKPYGSVEEAIQTWPTTASAIGIHRKEGVLSIYAPFGLEDLFSMVIRPNKRLITRDIYESKADKWSDKWPKLRVIPWHEA